MFNNPPTVEDSNIENILAKGFGFYFWKSTTRCIARAYSLDAGPH
jgi:hypothetical protein